MATIRDVAARAGVSTATVSHVLNNTRRVSPQTRQAVLAAIEQLDYRPSALARSLSTSITQTVGVLVADITLPFYAALVHGIEQRISGHDYSVIVCNTAEDAAKEAQYLELLYARHVDGLIIAATGVDQPMYRRFQARGIPMVFIDRALPVARGPVIGMDNVRAGYVATEHLLGLGHRDIAVLASYQGNFPSVSRADGYRQALADYGITTPRIRGASLTVAAATEAARALLSEQPQPTAVIATNQWMSIGLLHALAALKLRCPADVSVVCFGEHPLASVFTPPLTVIEQPVDALCDAATAALFHLLDAYRQADVTDAAGLPTVPDVAICPELISRASCRPPHPTPATMNGSAGNFTNFNVE